jgi:hypothetical protein
MAKEKGSRSITMKVKYQRKALWEGTINNFKDKKKKIDSDLKNMGIHKRVPLTAVIHLASIRPISFGDNWREEIRKMARRSKK